MIPKIIADRSASLVVSSQIGKLEISAERFAFPFRADPARKIELLRNYVFPDRVDGRDVSCVSSHGGNIRHSGIHVSGADGVSHGLSLIHNFRLRLVVGVSSRPT